MSAVLDATTAQRLAKLCGLFGSDHDGERAAAAAMADRLVRGLGLTWLDVIMPRTLPAPPTRSARRWRWPESDEGKLTFLLRHLNLLTDWERQFVVNLRRFHSWSPKQRAVVDRLVAKVLRETRAAA